MVVYVGALLLVLTTLPRPAFAQMSTYAVGYAYVDIVIDSGGDTISAISVNQTWGWADHTASAWLFMQSPDGRTFSHHDGYAETAMASGLLAVCTPATCHPGTYQVDNWGSDEYCPINYDYADSSSEEEAVKHDKFLRIMRTNFTKASIKRKNDQANLLVDVFRAKACPATSAEVGIAYSEDPTNPADPIVVTVFPPVGSGLSFAFSGSSTHNETQTSAMSFATPTGGAPQAD